MFHSWFSRPNQIRKADRRKANSRRRFRPSVESLETRNLLASFTWTGGLNGNFGDAASWTGPGGIHAVPGALDDAHVSGSDTRITVSSSRALNTFHGRTLVITGGTFTLNNVNDTSTISRLELDSDATLRTSGGKTVINTAEIAGTINTLNQATTNFIFGNVDLNPGASLIGPGQYLNGGAAFGGNLNVNTDIIAPASFRLIDGAVGGIGDITVGGTSTFTASSGTLAGSGQLTIQAGGTLAINGANATTIIDGRTIINHGTLHQSSTNAIVLRGAAAIDNRADGTILFDTNAGIQADGGTAGSLISTGLIRKTSGSGTVLLAAQLDLGGTIDVQSGGLRFSGGEVNNATITTAVNTTVTLSNDPSFVPLSTQFSGTVTFVGSGTVFSGPGSVTSGAQGTSFVVPASTSFNVAGQVAVPIGATFTVTGHLRLPSNNNSSIRGGGTFVANGNITHSGTGDLLLGSDFLTGAVPTTFRIQAGKIYSLASDGDIEPTGQGGILENKGTLRKTQGTGTSSITAVLSNTGELAAQTGTLALFNTTSTGGEVSAAAGATVQLVDSGNATFTQSGPLVISGAGDVDIVGGKFTLATTGSSVQVPAGSNFQIGSGAIVVPLNKTARIDGELTINTDGNVFLGGGGTLTFNGGVNHTGAGNLVLVGNGGTQTKSVLPVGKVYTLASDGDILQGSDGGGTLANNGAIVKSGGAGVSQITTIVSKRANFTVNSGTFMLNPTGGAFAGGTLNVAAGAVLELTGGGLSTTTMTGTFNGSGQGEIRLSSGNISAVVGGGPLKFDLPGGLFRWLGGRIDTNGNEVTIDGVVNIATTSQVGIIGGGVVHLRGTVNHSGSGSFNVIGSTLHIAAGASYNLQSTGGIFRTDSSVLNNDGILRKTVGTGTATISVPVSNSGQVISSSGTLAFTGGVSELVSGVLTGGSWSVLSNVSNEAAIDLGANVTTIGVAASVTLNGPNSGLSNLSGLATVNGNLTLTNSAELTTSGPLTNGGRITLSRSDLTVGGTYTQTSSGKLALQIVGGKIPQLKSAGASLNGNLIITASGTLPAVGSSFAIISSTGPVTGTFAGLANNSTFSAGGMTLRINYFAAQVRLTRLS